ncbi:hypothetical protein [Collinsella sp. An2]|uniref:hypothetical protein n=1 Tax=Collinsella sp. An2 TaxID=1965585 RepID=UPI000B395FD4|nr:hypothetical protein [Collinsella sp. An2]OUP07429.1 hypothetical protein B5F33_08760 [Collinsella sp. An2]
MRQIDCAHDRAYDEKRQADFYRAMTLLGWERAELVVADRFFQRLLGMGAPVLRAKDVPFVLGFPGCRAVHTMLMGRRIDVVFIDASGGLIEVHEGVGGGRLLSCPGATAVLERWTPQQHRDQPGAPVRPAVGRGARGGLYIRV